MAEGIGCVPVSAEYPKQDAAEENDLKQRHSHAFLFSKAVVNDQEEGECDCVLLDVVKIGVQEWHGHNTEKAVCCPWDDSQVIEIKGDHLIEDEDDPDCQDQHERHFQFLHQFIPFSRRCAKWNSSI